MSWLNRSEPVPAELGNLIGPKESLVAWTGTNTGFIAVTNSRLLLINAESWEARLWQDAIAARWDDPSLQITFSNQDQLEVLEISLAEPGLVPVAVRDRVTSVIVFDRVVSVPELGNVRFLARRTSDGISWFTMPISQIPDTEATRNLIASELQNLRANLGI